jgi:hypothetical protein
MAAIFGLVNSILYSLLGDDSFMGPFEWEPQQWTRSILYALCGMVVGLPVSGAFLRFASSGLRGSFFGRYGLMVFAICVGGASMGPLLVSIDVLFGSDFTTPRTLLEAASVVAYATVVGWILGAVEGATLAFPLAGILGAFGDRSTSEAQPQP